MEVDASFDALVYSFGKTSVARIGEVAQAIDTSAICSIYVSVSGSTSMSIPTLASFFVGTLAIVSLSILLLSSKAMVSFVVEKAALVIPQTLASRPLVAGDDYGFQSAVYSEYIPPSSVN